MHFEWMNNFILLNATGNHSPASNLNTVVNVMSSFYPVPNITLDFANKLNRESDSVLVLTNCKLFYNKDSYQITGKFERAQNYCNAEYSISGSKETISNIIYKYSISKPLTEISGRMSWFQEEVYIKYEQEPHRADFLMTTPFKYIEQNAFNYYYDFQHYRSYFTTEIQILQENFYLRSFINHPNVHTIDGTVDISSTFLPKLSVLLEHQFLGEMVEKFKVIYDDEKRCALDFEFSSDRSRYMGLNLEIPNHILKTRLEKDFNEDHKKWFVKYAWNNDTLLATLHMREEMDIDFNTTNDQYIFEVTGSIVEHKTQMEFENNDKILRIIIDSSTNNECDVEIYFDYDKIAGSSKAIASGKIGSNNLDIVSSTDFKLETFNHISAWKYNEWNDNLEFSYALEHYQLKNLILKWDRPSKIMDSTDESIQLLYSFFTDDIVNEPKISIVDKKYNESIDVSGKFVNSNETFIFLLSAESSNFDPIEIEFNYNLKQNIKTSELIVKWNKDVLKLYADAALNSSMIMGNIIINLSDNELTRINVLYKNASEIQLSAILNSTQRYQMHAKYELKQNAMLIATGIDTPVNGFKHLESIFDVYYDEEKGHAAFKLTKDSKLVDLSSSFMYLNELYSADILLHDSLFNLPNLNMKLETLGHQNLKLESFWNYNNEKAAFTTNLEFLKEKFKFNTTFQTSASLLPKGHLDVQYDITTAINTFGIDLGLKEDFLVLNGIYNTTNFNKEALLEMDSKLSNYRENVILKLGTGLNDDDVEYMNILLLKNESIYSIETSAHKDVKDVLYNFTISSPSTNWNNVRGKIFLVQKNHVSSAGIECEVDGNTIALSTDVHLEGANFCKVDIKFDSFLDNYETIHSGFMYDLRSEIKIVTLFLLPSKLHKDKHQIDSSLDLSHSGILKVNFNATSPMLYAKSIDISTQYSYDLSEKFAKALIGMVDVNKDLIDDSLFSLKVKTEVELCEDCVKDTFIIIKGQQFANKTHHVFLTTNILNNENDVSLYFTPDRAKVLELRIRTSFEVYPNIYLKASYAQGLINTSIQLNETNSLNMLLNLSALFTKDPLLKINTAEKEYLFIQVGQSHAQAKIYTENNYVGHFSYRDRGTDFVINFNASRNDAWFLAFDTQLKRTDDDKIILEYNLKNTFSANSYQKMYGIMTCFYEYKKDYYIDYTLFNVDEKLIDIVASINNITNSGFAMGYKIQTSFKSMQENLLEIRFYPEVVDILGAVSLKMYNIEKNIQGKIKISSNGDQGNIGISCKQSQEDYVHFNWILNNDNIEASLDTSHSNVKNMKLLMHRKIDADKRLYLFHTRWSYAIFESKLSLSNKHNNYDRGRIAFQLITPLQVLSSIDIDLRYHMFHNFAVDVEVNKKIYNFKIDLIQEENDFQVDIILNSRNPFIELFKISGKLKHVKVQDSIGSLAIDLFNQYTCTAKYQINLKEYLGDANFILNVQNVHLNIRGDYDVTDANDERINLNLEIPDRVYKLKSNLSKREGVITLTNYYKMHLQNRKSILWYIKKNAEEQQIGVEFSINKEKNTCMISLRPNFYGMKFRVLFDVRKVKSVVESEWSMEPGNEYITLDSTFMNNEVVLNSDIKHSKNIYFVNLNLEMPLNNIKNITYQNVLSIDNNFLFDGVLIWQIHNRFDNVTLKAEVRPSLNNLNAIISMQTPVTEPFMFKINYDISASNKLFIMDISSKGNTLVMMSGHMNDTSLNGNLESHMDGFSNFTLVVNQQNYRNFYMKYTTNKHATELICDISADHQSSDNNGEVPNFNVICKVDQKNLKGSAITHWSDGNSISLEFHFNPDQVHFAVESPNEKAKVINIDGSLNIMNKEMYSLTVNGNWNNNIINFMGSLQIKDNIPSMILLNMQFGDFFYNMNSLITKTNDLFDINFGTQSSVKALHGIALNLRVDQTQTEHIAVSLIADAPLKKEWKTELYVQLHNELSKKKFQIMGICMQQFVSISSSLSTEPAFGKYVSQTLIDIPILFQNPIAINIDLIDRGFKPVSCKIFLKYINTYELEAILNMQDNKLSVTIKNNALKTDLLLDLHGSFKKNKLEFQVAMIEDVFNGSYVFKDESLNSNLFIKLPNWNFISSTALNANLNMSNDQIFMELRSEGNNYKFNHSINYWRSSGKLQIEIITTDLNSNKPKSYVMEIKLKGPEYRTRYEVSHNNIFHFKLQERLNAIYFQYKNKLLFNASFKKDDGVVLLKYEKSIHNCTYTKTFDNHQIRMESPILPSKIALINFIARSKEKASLLNISLNSGKINLAGHLNLETVDNSKIFLLGISSSDVNISLSSRYERDHDGYKFDSEMKITNKITKFSFLNKYKKDREIELVLISDYLPNKELHLGASEHDSEYVAYIRNGHFGLNKFMNFTSNINLFEGRIDVLVLAPSCYYLKKYYLNIKIMSEMDYSAGDLKSSITSSAFGEHVIFGNFNLTSDQFKANSEFILHFPNDIQQKILSKLIVPFKLTNNFTPIISIKHVTFDKELLLYVTYINTPELLNVGGGARAGYSRLLGFVTVKTDPVPLLELSLDTPMENFKKIRLHFNSCSRELGCRSVSNYLIVNDLKMELKYSFIYMKNVVSTEIQLLTPFEYYDKYFIDLQYINIEKKALKAKFFYPALEEPLGFEFTYLLNGLLETYVVLNYDLPLNHQLKHFRAIIQSELFNGSYVGQVFFENIASKIGVSTKNMISSSDVESISAIYLWNKELNVLVSISNELSKHIVLKIDSVHQNKISQLINFTVQANKNYEMATDLHINSRRYISAKLIIDNSSAIFETNNIWRSMLLSYSYILKSNHKNIHALICWDLRNRINAQTGFKFVISRNSFSSYVAIPKLKLSFDYDVTSNNEIDNNTDKKTSLSSSGSIFWINQTFFGFDTSYKSHSNLDKSYYIQNFSVCILFPNKAVKYLNDIKIINTHEILLENREIEVHDKHIIFWDALNDLQNNITLYSFSNKDQIKLGILHPKLNHRIEARLKRSKKLESIKHPSSLMFELEYSTDPRDLLVIDYYHVESIENEKSFESGLEISHLSSNIFHGFVVNATLTEEITEYYLNLKYDNPQDDTQNFIRLLGRIHRNKPMIEGFLENDLNKLSGIFSTWSENNTRGLIMQAVSNENLPLVFKASLNSGQNDPSINFNIVAGPSKSYNIFGAIPSNKEIVAYLEHDLYGSLSKDASFNLRLNTTTLIWTKIHWKTGIWKEIRDNILNEYDDLQYIVENIGQSFVCMIPDNAGEKLYRDINSVTSNLTADFEISFLKLYYESSIGILNDMYQENHLYARTIADYINKTA